MRVADHRGGNRLRWLAQHRFEPPWATGITIRPDGGSGSVGGMTAELSIGRSKGPESRMEFEVRYTGGGEAMTGASRRHPIVPEEARMSFPLKVTASYSTAV